jgi:hypothetical protein
VIFRPILKQKQKQKMKESAAEEEMNRQQHWDKPMGGARTTMFTFA